MLSSPAQVVLPALLRERDLVAGNRLGLLREAAGQYLESRAVEEAEEPEGVAAVLGANLPETLGADELLEVLRGNGIDLLDQAQHPDDLLSLLAGESVEELLNRATAGPAPEEADLAHGPKVNTNVNR
jgi:hypothetical protein